MLAKIFLLFTCVTLLETYLLYVFGATLGAWWTLAMILSTALLGAFLTKREGLKIWRAWSEALGEGRLPEEGLVSGVLVLVGAVLLVTPGVLTDVTGILFLLPPTRRFFARHLRTYLEARFAGPTRSTRRVRVDLGGGRFVERIETSFGGFGASARAGVDPNVIDAEGEVVEEVRRGERHAQRSEEAEPHDRT